MNFVYLVVDLLQLGVLVYAIVVLQAIFYRLEEMDD